MNTAAPRLILFDIDGTLLSAHGIPRQAMATVLKKRFPDFRFDDHFDFSGRTDWEIIEHMLVFGGRPAPQDLIFQIFDDFANELEVQLMNGKKPHIHAGVETLLIRLQQAQSVYLGLVTGNTRQGARIKLQAAGLDTYFAVGGYGNESKSRNDLPPIAIHRAEKLYDQKFTHSSVWIVGDSVFDIYCAQVNRLHSLAVSTGWTSEADLKRAGPDYLFENLTCTEEIVSLFLKD